ncbi:hypothetical protein G7077_02760 [Sphingomonas piscis]|uniref:Uncharacterized protein n=1 Tax=Sphingomonas piscis TaxID=2714943 RepID=A0A6G7YMN0_9SPHN|nr:hypothetical protein [Sphingomonas piscis]QIK77991.1 hypothetical protein G7077_02760 [Sphingomonas piscis]
MSIARSYWPLALSVISLIVATYFTVTDKAYLMRGCRVEDYPELAFLLFIGPAALVAVAFGVLGLRSKTRKHVGASVVLSIVSIAATVGVLFEAGGGQCG